MIGDIVLQRRSGIVGYFVSWFTRSEWVHCGVVDADNNIVHVDWQGKHFTPIAEWSDVVVLTPIQPITPGDAFHLDFVLHKEPVQGYSFWNAVKSWFWKSSDDDKPTGKRYQCASFVSAMYRRIGIDLVPNRSDDTTQPQDFLTSPELTAKENGHGY